MQNTLMQKLHDHIRDNYPDLLLNLQQEGGVTTYLKEKAASVDGLSEQLLEEGKPAYIILDLCMEALTRELGPSKFNYISSLLEEEFEASYNELKSNSTLAYELVNLIAFCAPLFESFGFPEDGETDTHLRYALTAMIHEYLNR